MPLLGRLQDQGPVVFGRHLLHLLGAEVLLADGEVGRGVAVRQAPDFHAVAFLQRPRGLHLQPHLLRRVENLDADFPRLLHVVAAGQPVVELTVKPGIFVFLRQLGLQNALQGVQTARLHDLG